MTTINPDIYLEKEFQKQAAEVLQKLGYTILTPEECHIEREGGYKVLLRNILRSKLSELNIFEEYIVSPLTFNVALFSGKERVTESLQNFSRLLLKFFFKIYIRIYSYHFLPRFLVHYGSCSEIPNNRNITKITIHDL